MCLVDISFYPRLRVWAHERSGKVTEMEAWHRPRNRASSHWGRFAYCYCWMLIAEAGSSLCCHSLRLPQHRGSWLHQTPSTLLLTGTESFSEYGLIFPAVVFSPAGRKDLYNVLLSTQDPVEWNLLMGMFYGEGLWQWFCTTMGLTIFFITWKPSVESRNALSKTSPQLWDDNLGSGHCLSRM